jgi:hypothetical protein
MSLDCNKCGSTDIGLDEKPNYKGQFLTYYKYYCHKCSHIGEVWYYMQEQKEGKK